MSTLLPSSNTNMKQDIMKVVSGKKFLLLKVESHMLANRRQHK